MKKLIFGFLSLTIVVSLSCKKKIEDTVTEPEQPKDEIVYKALGDSAGMQSVRSYTYETVCHNIVPIPSDSTAKVVLDVNGDNVPDFSLSASHSPYTGTAYCGHCPNNNYQVGISALASSDSLAGRSDAPGTRIFSSGAVIDQNSRWTAVATLRLQSCVLNFDFYDGYVGFKMGQSFGYIHIKRLADNGLKILDIGFNKTPNRPITCGQK